MLVTLHENHTIVFGRAGANDLSQPEDTLKVKNDPPHTQAAKVGFIDSSLRAKHRFGTIVCPRGSVHKGLSTGVCPWGSVHGGLATRVCPQRSVHRGSVHRGLSTGVCPQASLRTKHEFGTIVCPRGSVHKGLSTGVCPWGSVHGGLSTGTCPQVCLKCAHGCVHGGLSTGVCPTGSVLGGLSILEVRLKLTKFLIKFVLKVFTFSSGWYGSTLL